jgi:hypothetical protein
VGAAAFGNLNNTSANATPADNRLNRVNSGYGFCSMFNASSPGQNVYEDHYTSQMQINKKCSFQSPSNRAGKVCNNSTA